MGYDIDKIPEHAGADTGFRKGGVRATFSPSL